MELPAALARGGLQILTLSFNQPRDHASHVVRQRNTSPYVPLSR